ncbi:hypothetical protein RMN57_36480 [Kitasatospora sp. CM 4170]|uniref:P68 RBP/TagC-like beta-propeller domain-containing protein n=1 Tax=Kitasatospora aburaviensis TaxID=67265 RepID=A0ABW1F9T8_9ACTN|nr:hypothetical protein [Kitasatospora sp. CM 4170]WNM49810.1 hypothetical protein RMN57_36480 [Kitasatospora sp. CM 4170]
MSSPALSRRRLMFAGAGVAAAAAAPLAAAGAAQAAAAPVNPANIPDGAPLIGVDHGSTRWAGSIVNRDTSTTLQGIAFDSVNGHLYTLQIAGASQVAYLRSGSQVAVTATIDGDQHAASGDLCLTKHDLSGAVLGHMYLLGFGHGVSLGIEPATAVTPAYVWTEASAATSGYGREIVRFPFADQTLLWTSHPDVRRLASPDAAATAMTPYVDAANGILLLRYALAGEHWFAAYDLTAARTAATDGTALPAPLARIQQPFLPKADANGAPTQTAATFQGFASHGRYVYLLDGDARTGDPSKPLAGLDKWTVHTTSMDLNGVQNDPATGYIRRTHSEADAGANPREPEGMAVYTGPEGLRLCFGITNNSASGTRQFDLYYKV